MDFYQMIQVHNRQWSFREMIGLAVMFVVVGIILLYFVKRRKISLSQAAVSLVLFVFLVVVFASTVFTRTPGKPDYELMPLWSWYEVIVHGDRELLIQILLNCVLLFPMGFLLPFVVRRRVGKLKAYLSGFVLAFGIETCQLIFRRGLFEWDDMIHNGLGCMLGCVVAEWLIRCVRQRKGVSENE